MGNKSKIDLLEFESAKNELIEKVYSTSSTSLKVFLYYNYINKIFSSNNSNLIEAFLKEFLDDYLTSIQRYEVYGISLEFTNKILQQLNDITSLTFIKDILQQLTLTIERIEQQVKKLNLILEGKEYENASGSKAYFPLIDKEAPGDFFGIIESVTIRIKRTTDRNKFIIVPSEKEIEKKISEQCKTSWQLAVELLKKYVRKPYQYHEVIISFDKREGFYEGNSLGIALTLTFLEELLRFYNPPFVIKIKERSAFTGGIDQPGNLLSIGEDLIKQKVAAVFFSEINCFVIPKLEETYASFALAQLKTEYPKRNLKLIPVEDISDVLNRRDLVEVNKINSLVRTGKFVRKSWVNIVVTLIMAVIPFFYFYVKIDNNPVAYQLSGKVEILLNKYGQQLTEINTISTFSYSDNLIDFFDLDGDGINEIFWGDNINNQGFFYVGNMEKDTLYKMTFNKSIDFSKNKIGEEFLFRKLKIYSDLKKNNAELLVATFSPMFASYIERIDLPSMNSKGILLNAGHILDFEIISINDNDENQLLVGGISNDWEGGFFAVINLNNSNGQLPIKNSRYIAEDFSTVNCKNFLVFPPTEIGKKFTKDHNWTSIIDISLNGESKTVRLTISEGGFNGVVLLSYIALDHNFQIIDISSSSFYDMVTNELYSNKQIGFSDAKKYLNNEYKNSIVYLNKIEP